MSRYIYAMRNPYPAIVRPLCAADIMYIARFYGRRRAGIHAAEKKDWVRRTN